MRVMTDELRPDERVSIALRRLYRAYGYRPYKVNKFEEYELYMRNKSFLTSEQILAFCDTDGRLMALKPDVTLSVVKNTRDSDGPLKLFYSENVYRVPRAGYGFCEIMQTGVELIGRVDAYAMGEVLMLAARSLAAVSGEYALDIADLNITEGILSGEPLGDGEKSELLAFISQKNLHGLMALCDRLGVSDAARGWLSALITEYGPLRETLPRFEALGLPEACRRGLEDLRAVCGMLEAFGIERVNLDFSVVNDMNYYNGLVFSGFIDGVASAVLSGGRYDRLMEKMGRASEAIGFAVYLDQLEQFAKRAQELDVDTLLLYDGDDQVQEAARAAQALIARGECVRVQRGAAVGMRCRRVIRMGKGSGEL